MRRFIEGPEAEDPARFWRAGAEEMALLEEVRATIVNAVLERVPGDVLVQQICRTFREASSDGSRRAQLDDAHRDLCASILAALTFAVDRDIPEDVLGATCADAVRLGEVLLTTRDKAYADGFLAGLRNATTQLH